MNIQKNKKKTIIVVAVLSALVGTASVAYALSKDNQYNDIDYKPALDRSDSDKEQSNSLNDNPSVKETTPNTDRPQKPSNDQSTPIQTVSLVASADIINKSVYLRGGINAQVGTNGECYAQLTGPSGQRIRKDTILLDNPGTTDCRTVEIPITELSTGRWTYTLNYGSNEARGVSSEVTFEIK